VSPPQRKIRDLHPLEAAQRQQGVILRIVRIGFLVLFVTVTLLTILNVNTQPGQPGVELVSGWHITVATALGFAVVVILVDIFTPQKKISTLFSIFLGLLAAMLATLAFAFVLDLLAKSYEAENAEVIFGAMKVLFGITMSYLAITTVLQTQDDFRLVIPYVEFSKQIRGTRPLLLDTSSLIDARIADVAETAVLQSPLVIPRFVINELQVLSDSSDKLKRARGRRGLEIIMRLQRSARLDVSIDEKPVPGKAVDQMLVEFAREMPATIVTTDVALSRIADIHEVPVLNLNDLANALKPALIPGEHLTVSLIKPGEQAGQAVGYLEDGTMVVAEDGAAHIGHHVTLTVTSTLQTSAGRLIFGRAGGMDQAVETPEPAAKPVRGPDDSLDAPEAGQGATGPERPDEPSRKGPFPPKKPNPRSSRARNPRR
jgi:uncharacterized protein YacL